MIKQAAILHNGIIYTDKKRHWQILDDNKHIPNIKEAQEGFITTNGMFVDREEAARIAHLCGQIKNAKQKLKSEDLY